jgi:flagellar motor component MotA
MVVGAYLRLKGMGELADTIIILGGALSTVGLGHKRDKTKAVSEEAKTVIEEAKKEIKATKKAFDSMEDVRNA